MSHDTSAGPNDRLEACSTAVASACTEPTSDFVGRVIARAEGATLEPAAGLALDTHLEDCAYCRALLQEHRASLSEPLPDWVGATSSPPSNVHPIRKRRGLVVAALSPVAAVAAAVWLTSGSGPPPAPPTLCDFEGQIAETMGVEPPPAPTRRVPRYARTSTIRVIARLDEEGPEASIYAFTLDDAGRLVPVPEQFVRRREAWLGARIEAPVDRLFPDSSKPTTLVLCASKVPSSALVQKTLAEVERGSRARCVAQPVEVQG